ncbi:fumarylacetoacetate hydrolase family protein [Polynucleobacter sp. IMCC 29146]|uniref:fumarylacetoacetate hydrolase family protein n=1 Tax=Polynucleobacter sp. IMCC 29146 TaxID=2780953 RepID=UPI001F34D059|nr:fumarylacetoacetate hydrolase family protein [Polynucleobacter sp. IMCC 29146]MCE7529092.1 fumarylacetoacetate hydrolase family protein [Polynucleobacter sp. IMCC 29146]
MSTEFVIAAPKVNSIPIEGDSRRFPVNRIYCVGRNYADHAREMGHDPDREPPFFFMKPATSIVTDGKDMQYPSLTQDLHHEIEMVVAIGIGGSNIAPADALNHVWGYGVGLDMTRRDLQGEAKKMGRPWDTGKAFDESAPCASLVPVSQCGHLAKGLINLKVNGVIKQEGDLAMMIWIVPDTIAYLSTLFALEPGDLIFSGTPAGVAAVKKGDVLEGYVAGLPILKTKIA